MDGLDPAIGYPSQIANDVIPFSNHPMEMTGSSPIMTGLDRCAPHVNSKGGEYKRKPAGRHERIIIFHHLPRP